MTELGETAGSDEGEAESEMGVAPPCFVTYLFVLPEPLLIQHGSTWTYVLDKYEPTLEGYELAPLEGLRLVRKDGGSDDARNRVSLRFWQVIKDDARAEVEWAAEAVRRVAASIIPETASTEVDESASWVGTHEVVTVVEAAIYVATSEDLRATGIEPDPLSRCIEVLLNYHRAYRVRGREHVPSLSYQRLFPMVMELRRAFPGVDEKPRVQGVQILDHGNLAVPPEDFLDEDAALEIAEWHKRMFAGDPFTLYAERRLEAEIEGQRNGRMGESIVQVGTASEVLLDGLLALMLWEEGVAPEEAGALLSGPLVSRLESHATYCARLKGQWSRKSEPLRGWYNRVWVPRSRVLHGNYRPSKYDAMDTMGALITLESYIGDRLKVRWRQYPHTAWLFLGESGFAKRGGAGAARRWSLEQEDGTGQWARRYRAWRDTVDPHVER